MIVLWRVTQRCNLSCPFCAYDRRMTWPRREADAALVRQFGVVLANYQRETGDSVLVSWIGGEPFLFPPLAELTTFFTDDLGLRVSATTNGTLLSRASVRAHVLDHYEELTVSVDGIDRVQNDLRGWLGGYSALRKSIGKLSESRRRRGCGPRLRANVVLMRQTIGDFEKLCGELGEWGIEEITFNQLGGRDRPEFFAAHRLLPEHSAWLVGEIAPLRARLARLGVRLQGSHGYISRIDASARDVTIPILDCHPGEQFLFVNEMGLASPCHFTTQDYGVPVAELVSARDLLGLPGRFAGARRGRRPACCEDCHSTRVFDKFAT